MKFFNKWYIIIWIVIIMISFLVGVSLSTYFWDGFSYDEEKLMELCGITVQDYMDEIQKDPSLIDNDTSVCPDAYKARIGVGGVRTDWIMVIIFVISASIIYNLIYRDFILRKRK